MQLEFGRTPVQPTPAFLQPIYFRKVYNIPAHVVVSTRPSSREVAIALNFAWSNN